MEILRNYFFELHGDDELVQYPAHWQFNNNAREFAVLHNNEDKGANADMANILVKGLYIDKKMRPDGRYQARYRDKDGKLHSVYGKTPDEAQKKALEYMLGKRPAKRKKSKDDAQIPTLKEWIEKWYNLYKASELSPDWAKKVNSIINKYILSSDLSNKRINRINLIDLQKLINDIPHPWSRNRTNQLIKDIFEKAAAAQYIKFNIALGLKNQSYEYTQRRPLTLTEYRKLVDYLNSEKYYNDFKFVSKTEMQEFAILIRFYIATGLRRREALGIEPKDIDFRNNCILIKQQIDLQGKKLVKLKTKSSYRYIPLFEDVKELIKNIDLTDRKFLFSFHPQTVTKRFRQIIDNLNIHDIDVHCLRHTFTYFCERKGIPEEVIQRWLGHSKSSNATPNYKHKMEIEEVEIIKDYLKNNSKFDT